MNCNSQEPDVIVWGWEALDCEPRKIHPPANLRKVRSTIRQKMNQIHLKPENGR